MYSTVTHGIQHYFDTVKQLRGLVKKHHIDVLIDIDGILDMYTLPLKRGTGVKVISWEHFNYLQNPGVPYRKLTRPWAARKADAIVTLTTADRGQPYTSSISTPNVRSSTFRSPMIVPSPAPVYAAASQTILCSGRLTYQKGFDMLVDVAEQVLPRAPGLAVAYSR